MYEKRATMDILEWYKEDIASPSIVVNQITWVTKVEEAFDAIGGGKTDAMSVYY